MTFSYYAIHINIWNISTNVARLSSVYQRQYVNWILLYQHGFCQSWLSLACHSFMRWPALPAVMYYNVNKRESLLWLLMMHLNSNYIWFRRSMTYWVNRNICFHDTWCFPLTWYCVICDHHLSIIQSQYFYYLWLKSIIWLLWLLCEVCVPLVLIMHDAGY